MSRIANLAKKDRSLLWFSSNLSKICKIIISLNQINYRRCISCRKIAPKQNFWRIVRVAPDNRVQLDRGMGRSAYLCPNIECLTNAQSKNRLRSALKTRVDDRIYQSLQERLS